MNLNATNFCLENARELAKYASRAYSDDPTISDPKTDTQVLISELVDADCIVIAFRGTSSLRDFLTDADCLRAKVTCGQVHQGFWEAWLGVKEAIKAQIPNFEGKRIYVTGHSLGGALAIICAKYLAVEQQDVCGVYAFGAPRVGDKQFQVNYNNQPVIGIPTITLGEITFTLINDTDAVPRVPFWPRYRRPGHDEFISPLTPNRVDEDPNVLFRLLSDITSLYAAWRARRNPLCVGELLLDHRINNYIAALGVTENQPATFESAISNLK